ncbi:YCF48-related protein [Ramlibacter sp. WS9]|uniref:WD40/YVTN/BNR-like repeat-containing protein n=1 Tax=Ramlibacter sp. WS9 TaxID=1882741 RepID=UPI0013053CF1|nr:YCF48-related protein [Ramlibacter sp. WS9]
MPYFRTLTLGTALATTLALTPLHATQAAGAAAFADPLDTPARVSPRAVRSPVFALAPVDADHIVGVGPRGHILRSADRGKTWTQQPSPVSTDLVAVHFPTPKLGWAVGHDGVVLRSTDGGVSWTRVLDGRGLGKLMVAHYEKALVAGDTSVAKALEDAKRMAAEGPTKPFLSVYFRSANEGWLVGQFNLILHTADGGATWQPWLDRTENPDGYSLHAIRAAGDEVYIVGELGLVLGLDAGARRFKRIKTPYPGTWFGLAAMKGALVAVGLRGAAWASTDAGANWRQLNTATNASINNGMFLPDGRLVLVTQQGRVLTSADLRDIAELPRVPGLASAFDIVTMEPGWLLISGPGGVQRLALPPAPQ